MSLAAVWLPAEGDLSVVARTRWRLTDMADQLACPGRAARILVCPWSPASGKTLVMAVDPELGEPANERAVALAGPQRIPISGTALLVLTRTGLITPVSFSQADLAALAVKLLVNEVILGALPAGDGEKEKDPPA